MRCLVTGCAGFIGSHLTERLLVDGHEVVGIDAFTDYYPHRLKESNLRTSMLSPHFTFLADDLLSLNLEEIVRDIDVVFHQAAQAGVRHSWGQHFDTYTRLNVLATQRLLEACRTAPVLRRVVYASSSSVYGNATQLPVSEDAPTHPLSPYGVTKLAAEHLCSLYHANFGLPTVSLRYFTVYGARQRPDMAFHRFIRAALDGNPITVHEDGMQTRDFTHVSDIVQANVLASVSEVSPGRVYNVAGGARTTLAHALSLIEKVTGRKLIVEHAPKQSGDVRDTYADTSRARQELGYAPSVDLETGLRDEAEWVAATLYIEVV